MNTRKVNSRNCTLGKRFINNNIIIVKSHTTTLAWIASYSLVLASKYHWSINYNYWSTTFHGHRRWSAFVRQRVSSQIEPFEKFRDGWMAWVFMVELLLSHFDWDPLGVGESHLFIVYKMLTKIIITWSMIFPPFFSVTHDIFYVSR